MLKKALSVLLIILVTNLAVVSAFGQTKEEKESKFAEKVKSEIAKLGVGKDAKVTVKLKDGTKLKGYITEVKADSFVVMNEKTNITSEVSYSQVKKAQGKNSKTGTILGIAAGIGILAIIILIAGRN